MTPRVEVVREAAVTQLEMTYIGRRKGGVSQWVALWPIFEVCARDTGYEEGGISEDE